MNSQPGILESKNMKELVDALLRPLIRRLKSSGVQPGQITVLAFLANLISLYFLFENHFYFVLFMLFNIFLDNLDGRLARATSTTSKFGDALDKFSDHSYGIFLFLKAGSELSNDIFYVGALLYALHMLLFNQAWKTVFNPNATILRITFVLKYYVPGAIIQSLYYAFAYFGTLLNYSFKKED